MKPATRVLILLLVALLVGCSMTRFAYRNADWLIEERLDDYVDLSAAQSEQLRAALQSHLAWHCRSQLPAYIDWIERIERVAEDPTPEAVAALYSEFDRHLAALIAEITPTAQALLADLDAEQRRQLARRLDARHEELLGEYAAPPLETQVVERAERMERRLDRWLGALTPTQRERVLAWSQTLGEHSRYWLENRRVWQDAVLATLEPPLRRDLDGRVTELLQRPQGFYTEEYRMRRPRATQAAVELIADLLSSATPGQRAHLRQALADLRRDLSALSCGV